MPPLSHSDYLAARVDLGLFELIGLSIRVLGVLFATAIILGIARALVLVINAAVVVYLAWRRLRAVHHPQQQRA